MRAQLLLLLIFFIRGANAFVYSCEEVKFKLTKMESVHYTAYAYVITQEGFTNWDQLSRVKLTVGVYSHSFVELAQNPDFFPLTNNQPGEQWSVQGDASSLRCDQEFTLILKSDDLPVLSPPQSFARFPLRSGVFVVPQCGMWFAKKSSGGEGTVTVYTGAGKGEEEERYALQSWSCESMPDWIYSFDSVVTIEATGTCRLLMLYSSDLTKESMNTISPNDKVVVLSNGRSENLQNRVGTKISAFLQIENSDVSNVTVNMELSFDSSNTGYVGLAESEGGKITQYQNGTYMKEIQSNYLEISWRPSPLLPSKISNNNDNIYVEIDVSADSRDSDCPEGYSLVSSNDGQHWCYDIMWHVPPVEGFNFEDSDALCDSQGASLPIVNSSDVNFSLFEFANTHLAKESIWLGIICDEETSTWIWQSGEPLNYNAFDESQEKSCAVSTHVAQDTNQQWRAYGKEQMFSYSICARRPLSQPAPAIATTTFQPTTTIRSTTTTTSTTSTTTTSLPPTTSSISDRGLFAWTIAAIIARAT